MQQWTNGMKKKEEQRNDTLAKEKFFIGIGVKIAAARFNCRGCELWTTRIQISNLFQVQKLG
jgi:hypothetical protein